MFWCCSNFFLSFKKYRDLNSKEINLHFTEKCSENFYLGGAARCNQLSVTSWLPWPICTRSSPCMSDSTSLELRWWKSARPSTHYWPLQVRSAGPADLWIQHRWSDGQRQASSITPSINRVSLVISFFLFVQFVLHHHIILWHNRYHDDNDDGSIYTYPDIPCFTWLCKDWYLALLGFVIKDRGPSHQSSYAIIGLMWRQIYLLGLAL
jgi:hypothetical protein